ncbi:hypothetical protein ABI_09500 [Asticcacaulis biprosthecium C19]|uniref:Uncharacterized protein n=1 Tax=Asticcacaulis biprosthecium C19 TaxID=715226 RepID=F4QGR1_9CAUL|nr:hypothetical protein [Asticcacaulis biprosthecium]EGF92513.1 hypothetical protein ABI_09500 [Asticcacaulis biprosthecium C19]
MIYVYWKSVTARLGGPVHQARRTVAAALTAIGFTVSPEARALTAERRNGLPGFPFAFVWTARIDPASGGQAKIAIEYGLRATTGTWVAFGLAIVLVFPLVLISEMAPALTMIPILPVVWLFGAMVAMKLHQAQLERRLWQTIGAHVPVTGFETSVRAVS